MKSVYEIVIRRRNTGKIFCICMIFLLCFFSNSTGQYGFRTGTTVSSFYYPGSSPVPYQDYDVDLRPFLGYDVELVQTGPQKPLISNCTGVFYNFNLVHRLGLRPELNFTQKGVNFSRFDYEKIIYKVRISYLELPVSLTYKFIQKANSLAELYFGGYGAYSIRATKITAFTDTSPGRIKITSVRDFEAGLHTGFTYKYGVLDGFILFDLRLFLGLTDIFELPDGWTNMYFDNHKTRITGLHFSAGYEF